VEDPLEEQVAILNVTTRSFGAGERGWAGRTVKLRSLYLGWAAEIEILARLDKAHKSIHRRDHASQNTTSATHCTDDVKTHNPSDPVPTSAAMGREEVRQRSLSVLIVTG